MYIIIRNRNPIAYVPSDVGDALFTTRRGRYLSVEFAYHYVCEELNANRDVNLVNASCGRLVRTDRESFVLPAAKLVNPSSYAAGATPEFVILDELED